MKINVFIVCNKDEAQKIMDRIYPDVLFAADTIHYFVPGYKMSKDDRIVKITIEIDHNYRHQYYDETEKNLILNRGFNDGWGYAFHAYPCQVVKYYFGKEYMEKFDVCSNYVDPGLIEAIYNYYNKAGKELNPEWEFNYGVVHTDVRFKKGKTTNEKYDVSFVSK